MAQVTEFQHKNNPTRNDTHENWHVSTWAHRAWFATGCAAVLFSLAKSLHSLRASTNPRPWLESILAAVAAYVLSDLGTGIYHWAIDNYGAAGTPVFGPQIEAFQGHHEQPWAITKRHLANNLYQTAATVAAFVFPVSLFSGDPAVLAFVGVFAGLVIFSQQFHAWAHTPRGKLPPVVAALQDAGILLAQPQHAAHHRPPYNNNYCIVSGLWNGFLDRSGFFLGLEMVLDRVAGYRPRSWTQSLVTCLDV
ncbi:hypothetical protein DH2020_033350 [Rehmannia glutinosa]|uniref:Lipid desaturase domain-containing protein n=1 Tax=Rehmannia glutinosa TaxID=99300 RepID=A0ABR0VFQ6_REHGL